MEPAKLRFKEHLQHSYALTEREWEVVCGFCDVEPLAKGEYFIRDGRICRKLGFIADGVMRYTRFEESGDETTCYFMIENDFVGDPESFEAQKPSDKNLHAITECTLVTIRHQSFGGLLKELPRFREIMAAIDRVTMMTLLHQRDFLINRDAASRYDWFVKHFSQVIMRVPLSHVASFLDITQQSLSRLRKQRV
jgi:CRP-like cAMP-binding protein